MGKVRTCVCTSMSACVCVEVCICILKIKVASKGECKHTHLRKLITKPGFNLCLFVQLGKSAWDDFLAQTKSLLTTTVLELPFGNSVA